jgi:hypothetical protein
MSAEVIHLRPEIVGDGYRFDADEVLDAAKGQNLGKAVIVGELPDGTLWVSSTCGAGDMLLLIERAKRFILPDE